MALLTTTYQWLLTVHILAAVIWVGGAFALQMMAIRVVRDPNPARLADFARDVEVVGMRVFLPASLVLLAFGFWLVHEGNWSLSEGWLTFGLIVIAISIVTGAGFLGPESGRIAKIIDAEGPASPEARRRISRIFLVSRIELILLLLTVVAMAAKPGM
jgi:uncharacterized membrane protein